MDPSHAPEHSAHENDAQSPSSPQNPAQERLSHSPQEQPSPSHLSRDQISQPPPSHDIDHLDVNQDTIPETEDWSPTEALLIRETGYHIPVEPTEPISYRTLSWGAWGLVLSMLLVYQMSTETSFRGLNTQDALSWGANYPPHVIGPDAEWWRLITAAFLHWVKRRRV